MNSEVFTKVITSLSDHPLAPETHFLLTTGKKSFKVKKSELYPIQKNYIFALEQLDKKDKLHNSKKTVPDSSLTKRFMATRIKTYKFMEKDINEDQILVFNEEENGEINLLLEAESQGIYLLTFNNDSYLRTNFRKLSNILRKSGKEYHLSLRNLPKE